jgi:hypothetical protein
MPLSEEQRRQIVVKCTSIKASLRQLHRSDASLRVNRGQLYEFIGTKLMARLNGRIVANRLDGGDLVASAARYDTALVNFRTVYQNYEEGLSATLRIDCVQQPEDFYYSVADIRKRRLEVYQRVTDINRYIDEYYEAFGQFSEDFRLAVKGVMGE